MVNDLWLVLPVLAVACGPAVGTAGDASTTADDDGTATTTPSEPDTSTGGTAPTTGASTSDPGPESSSGNATTDADSSAGTSTGGGFEPAPCDVWTQDCPEGEKCNAYAKDGGEVWNALGCFPVVGKPDGPGAPCMVEESGTSGFDTCAVGSMCWGVGDDLQGECVPLCTGSELDPVCNAPEHICMIANEFVLVLCLETCDPDDVDPCPEGDSCVPTEGGWVCAPGVDDGPETCDDSNCSPGTVCVLPEVFGPECEAEMGCCTDYCELDAPRCSRPQHTCVALYPEDPPPGFENVGACVLP